MMTRRLSFLAVIAIFQYFCLSRAQSVRTFVSTTNVAPPQQQRATFDLLGCADLPTSEAGDLVTEPTSFDMFSLISEESQEGFDREKRIGTLELTNFRLTTNPTAGVTDTASLLLTNGNPLTATVTLIPPEPATFSGPATWFGFFLPEFPTDAGDWSSNQTVANFTAPTEFSLDLRFVGKAITPTDSDRIYTSVQSDAGIQTVTFSTHLERFVVANICVGIPGNGGQMLGSEIVTSGARFGLRAALGSIVALSTLIFMMS